MGGSWTSMAGGSSSICSSCTRGTMHGSGTKLLILAQNTAFHVAFLLHRLLPCLFIPAESTSAQWPPPAVGEQPVSRPVLAAAEHHAAGGEVKHGAPAPTLCRLRRAARKAARKVWCCRPVAGAVCVGGSQTRGVTIACTTSIDTTPSRN
eukprot:gene15331-biopygen15722